jgi:O-antigen ligase
MIAGFLAGRAILSISMFVFLLNAMTFNSLQHYSRQKWWLLGLAWVGFFALSYFWSTNIPFWEERVQTKFAFLMLPLAFGLLPAFSLKQLKIFTFCTALLLAVGCCYSYSFLWRDPQGVINGYFTSKVMPTPAYGDHICYSIFVAWFGVWCCYMLPYFTSRVTKFLIILALIFFIVYLHILAVKSGLLIFYIALIMLAIYLALKKKRKASISILAGLVLVVFGAYKTLPSFQHKAGYLKYTYEEYFERGNLSANFSDMGRIISYKVAWKLIKQHPIYGVGAGDMMDDMRQEYHQNEPSVSESQILLPHNQMMVNTLAGGIIGLILFLVWLLYPLKKIRKDRSGYFTLITWTMLLVPLLVEPFLEIQFGVFVYLFCLLWMQKSNASLANVE